MKVYVLSNQYTTLGVFSNILEAQKGYYNIYKNLEPLFKVKLEEFDINSTISNDVSRYLINTTKNKRNGILRERKSEFRFSVELNKKEDSRIYEPIECEFCYGEDCRDGCVNDNTDY